ATAARTRRSRPRRARPRGRTRPRRGALPAPGPIRPPTASSVPGAAPPPPHPGRGRSCPRRRGPPGACRPAGVARGADAVDPEAAHVLRLVTERIEVPVAFHGDDLRRLDEPGGQLVARTGEVVDLE